MAELKTGAEENWELFVSDLKTGVFEGLCLDQPVAGALKETNGDADMDIVADEEENRIPNPVPVPDEEEENRIPMQENIALGSLPESLQKAAVVGRPRCLLIKTLPPEIPKEELIKVCSQLAGFAGKIELGEPNPLKKFYRIGWIHMKEGADLDAAIEFIESQRVLDFKMHLGVPKDNDSRIRYCPMEAGSEERLRKDLVNARSIAAALNGKYGLEDPFDMNEEWRMQYLLVDADNSSIENVKKALDIYLTFLRRVYHVCYYSGVAEFDCANTLIRKTGNLILRRSSQTKSIPTHDLFFRGIEGGLERFFQDPLTEEQVKEHFKCGGMEEGTEKQLRTHMSKEKEEKYRVSWLLLILMHCR